MSSVSNFKSLVYYGSENITVLKSSSKGWKELGTYAKGGTLPAAAQKALADSVLVLVSDSYLGHLQLLLDNKKSVLSDENIAQILADDYEIDTSVYEFASQKFTLSREQVQLSISGIEREAFDEIEQWITAFAPKKAWLMPFGWFVSALKSVEPVLLAIALSEDEILVSHHYLGVDDAREVSLDDLVAYIKSRKAERKETHLLYFQAEDALQEKIVSEVGETVATHPLSEDKKETVLATIADAVWEKGEEALADLLHFEISFENTKAAVPVETKREAESESPESEEIDSQVTADLPKPQPPQLENEPEEIEIVESSVSTQKSEEESSNVDTVEPESIAGEPPVKAAIAAAAPAVVASAAPSITEKTAAAAEVEEPVLPAPKEAVTPVTKPVETQTEDPETTETVPVAAPDEKAAVTNSKEIPPSFVDLTPAGVARASESRYREVPRKSSWKLAFAVFLGVVLLTSIIGGAIFWSQQTVETATPLLPTTTPSPSPVIAAEPEATESADTVDAGELLTEEEKAELSVLVLNALGTPGLAGDTQDEIESAGWSEVSVGNATGSYDDAIFVYTENEKVIATLENDLDIEITAATDINESRSDDYDVVFIIADEVPWQ